jgi:hypothetical protein
MFSTLLFLLFFGQQQQYFAQDYSPIIPKVVQPKHESLDLLTIPKYREYFENDIYSDVLSHSKQKPHGDHNGRYTNVHETAHGIHNELRQKFKPLLKRSVNGFYCLKGKAVIVDDPNIKMRHVAPYIPDILRSSRFKLYLIEQLQYWDDTPTYIFDEWTCYILGAECAVDDSKRNIALEKTNAVSGALEFSIYSVGFAMAVKEHDPLFWKTNNQFKSFIKYNLIRAERVFNAGVRIPAFHNNEQNRLQQALLNHKDAEPIREFLKTEFDGIFVD